MPNEVNTLLNELFLFSRTLDELSIKPIIWHKEYKELPKATPRSPCYRIWVTESGTISGIDTLKPELVKILRKYGNKQASFPALNIVPLYRVTMNGKIREDNWLKSKKRIDKVLKAICDRFINAIGGDNNHEVAVAMQLAVSVKELSCYGFRKALEECLINETAKGKNELINILEFIGKDGMDPEKNMGPNISIVFDLAEWQNYDYPIASEEMTYRLNQALIRSESVNDMTSFSGGHDAFGTAFDALAKSSPMPEVKLPGFTIILRSMFKGQPCQKRYGRFDDASYPISKLNRVATKGAIEWISKDENKYFTWVKAGRDEIVFAYPSKIPDKNTKFAAILSSIEAKGPFEKIAKDFLRSFSGLEPSKRPEYIHVFSIRKMDRGRSKIVFTRNLQPEEFVDSAKNWQKGCRNIPDIGSLKPIVPFPLDVAGIINTLWKQNGEQVKHRDGSPIVKRVHVYQGLELLFDTNRNNAKYFLSILVSNAFGLIVFTGNNRFCSTRHNTDISNTVAILGLLLYKNNFHKEFYMKDTAFLTGQLLKLSDELHTLYGRVVRNDVPTKLVGSSMLISASDMPNRALVQLMTRMIPYLAWAKSYRYKHPDNNNIEKEKHRRKVFWLVNLFESIASQLHEALTEDIRFTDFDKAQLFLGYLSALPQSRPSNGGVENDVILNKGVQNNG